MTDQHLASGYADVLQPTSSKPKHAVPFASVIDCTYRNDIGHLPCIGLDAAIHHQPRSWSGAQP